MKKTSETPITDQQQAELPKSFNATKVQVYALEYTDYKGDVQYYIILKAEGHPQINMRSGKTTFEALQAIEFNTPKQ